MSDHAPRQLAFAVTLALGLSGCPVTDNYYIDSGNGAAGASTAGGSATQAGTHAGGSLGAAAGSAGVGGGSAAAGDVSMGMGGANDMAAAGAPMAGAPDTMQGGSAGSAGCVPAPERCNGRDDNCNGIVDDFACADGCSGFVLADPEHGYMFCSGFAKANWYNAATACMKQNEHLVSIESSAENVSLVAALDPLTAENYVFIGASDAANEGTWKWPNGTQFWNGGPFGYAVGGAFHAWYQGMPDNHNGIEDCAVLRLAEKSWDDRSCGDVDPFVCEE